MTDRTETPYQGTLLPDEPTTSDLRTILPDYEAMFRTVGKMLADRYERRPDYPWIDTKRSLITGEDFPEDDPLRGPQAVAGWIQGRGLESLATHCRWFGPRDDAEAQALRVRLETIMTEVLAQIRKVRARNGGHVFFFMTPGGDPFELDETGAPRTITLDASSPCNYSDLFTAKGMYAAAAYLKDAEAQTEARDYLMAVDEAIRTDAFVTDQQALDPKNPIRPVPGRHSHGPYMIQVGTAGVLADWGQDAAGVDMCLGGLRHILDRHINLDNRWPDLRPCDYVEFIDNEGAPYRTGEHVICDPGHSLEWVGLTLKLVAAVDAHGLASPEQRNELARSEAVAPRVLQGCFDLGFQSGPGGICKFADLVSREPVNSDMPWWSLPETIRAAAYCLAMAQSDEDRATAARVLAACHNAFTKHYVRPDLSLMAVQTATRKGMSWMSSPATTMPTPATTPT
ncbi:MAG: hypothetical protein GY851_32475 [bacterium]|nr:hypothetical protein [bacterium]